MAKSKKKAVKPKRKAQTSTRPANTETKPRVLPDSVGGTRYSQFDSGDDEAYGIRAVDFRLFIMGVEVTEHCVGSIAIQRQGRDGDGTLSFTLDNNYDKFVLRTANFASADPGKPNAYNRGAGGKDWQEDSFTRETWNPAGMRIADVESDSTKAKNFIDPNRGDSSSEGLFLFSEHAKRGIYNRKHALNAEHRKDYIKLLVGAQATLGFAPYVDNYRLMVGEAIVCHMDHVRCFIMDPLMDPAEVYSGEISEIRWMPAFTGFADIVTKSTDVMTGKATLEISCMDIRTVLKRKRMLVNATASDGTMMADASAGVAGLYANLTTEDLGSSNTANDMQEMNFKQVLAAIFSNHTKTPPPEQSFIETQTVKANTAALGDILSGKIKIGDGSPERPLSGAEFAKQTAERNKVLALRQAQTEKLKKIAEDGAREQAAREASLPSRKRAAEEGLAGLDATAESGMAMQVFMTPGNYVHIPGAIKRIRGETGTDAKSAVGQFGVGRYAIGHYLEFPNTGSMSASEKKATIAHFMSDWAALTIFGVNRTWYDEQDVNLIGGATYPGGDYSCFVGFVHYMEPTSGLGIRQFMDSTRLSGLGVDRDYKSVYEIINSICDRIDYQFQVNGMGDIMIEPPFYDLLPGDLGDWKYVHAVGNSVRTASVNDDTNSNPVTCLKVSGGAQNVDDPNVENQTLVNQAYTIFVKSDYLTDKYGFVEEDREIPFVTKVSAEVGGATVDSEIQKLVVMGILEFTKMLAGMSSVQVEAAFNPFLYPNRPYLAYYERRAGTTAGTTVNLDIGVSASSSVELTMIRAFNDAGVCATITGFQGTPFSLNNPDDTLTSLMSMDGGALGNGIRTKAGIEVFTVTNDGKLERAPATKFTGGKTKGLDAMKKDATITNAVNALLRNHPGLQASDLVGVMLNESGGDRYAKNRDKPENSAAGIQQLVRASYLDTLGYARRKGLAWPAGANPVDTSSAHAYQDTFCSAYDEAAQLRIWDIYLQMTEAAAGGKKIDSAAKIAFANNGIVFLKNPNAIYVDKSGKAHTADVNYVNRVVAAANSDYAKGWSQSSQTASSQETEAKAGAATGTVTSTPGGAAVKVPTGTSAKVGASGATPTPTALSTNPFALSPLTNTPPAAQKVPEPKSMMFKK